MNNSKEFIRTFIAIDIEKELQEKIRNIYKQLDPISTFVKLVKPEDIHITLKFFAYFQIDKLPLLYTLIEKQTTGTSPFAFKISGLGAFPNWKHPSVIWLGIAEGAKEIQTLQAQLENAINAESLVEKEERPFAPHITIARIKEPKGIDKYLKKIDGNNNVFDNTWIQKVDNIKLIKSTLSPSGSQYSILKTFQF